MPDLFPFLAFPIPAASQPLSRFLPLFPNGLVSSWLTESLPQGSLVLDPFGSQPRLAIEAAQLGYRVLVTCNNPIERFLLDLAAHPLRRDEMQAALADLSVIMKGEERIEAHIRSLYSTECANCGERIEVQAFVWQREAERIQERIYECPFCNDSGSRPATQDDMEHAAQFKKGGLNWFRAIERVTPKDDPDRTHAEEALETYTPRAVNILVNLINVLDRFPAVRQRELRALLLAAFEQANSLWSFTTVRERPRQLKSSPFYIEKNIWLALEESIDHWSVPEQAVQNLNLTEWPDLPPETGGICLFPGPVRQLAEQLNRMQGENYTINGILAALPRPNQAYWTLSALWAGWLWGQEATAVFKSVLRRRRYDWQWHSAALASAFESLNNLVGENTRFWVNIGECETGFLAAALVAAELANFELDGLALREEVDQAQARWIVTGGHGSRASRLEIETTKQLQSACRETAVEHLKTRREPASFGQLSAAALVGVVKSWNIQPALLTSPMEKLSALQAAANHAFNERSAFERLGASEKSAETGQWWLTSGRRTRSTSDEVDGYSLSDRVEMTVVRYLVASPGCSFEQVDQETCRAFDGLFTPNRDLVLQCLASYGQPVDTSGGGWYLRPQDDPASRREDLNSISKRVKIIGGQLSLEVNEVEYAAVKESAQSPVQWRDRHGKIVYTFFFLASTTCSKLVALQSSAPQEDFSPLIDSHKRNVLVMPGSRSGLMLFKLEEDLQLKRAVESSWRLLKFRLVHRLADNQGYELSLLEKLFDLDPLAYKDPQIPLI